MIDAQVYLLAAGNGRRAGGPKAWALHAGKTLLEDQLEFLRGVVRPSDTAVTIQADWSERCAKLSAEVRWTPVDPSAKPLGALQAALRGMAPRGWAFVYHVDMPVWEPALFQSLYDARFGDAVAPEKGGRKGHPVLLSEKACEEVLALDPTKDRLDHFLRHRKEASLSVPFDCIHANWNEAIPK